MKAQDVQAAFEKLVTDGQDQDTVNHFFRHHLSGERVTAVKIVRPDRDAICVGPLVDVGDGQFTQLVTVQIEITVDEIN